MRLRAEHLLLLFYCCFTIIACSSDRDDNGEDSSGTDVSMENACSAFSFARGKIANGQVCTPSSQNSPLVRLVISSLGGTGVCTGVVIDNDKVLTAAHCVENDIFGISVQTTAGNFSASRFAFPSTYRDEVVSGGSLGFDDIAVVFTSESMGILPMPILVSESPSIGEEAFIGGFGETAPGALDARPRAGRAIVANVNQDHITIRFEGNQAHPCQGDSGGPLVVERAGSRVVTGVVAQSAPGVRIDQICRPGDITLYTNVRAPGVISFLGVHAPDAPAL
jgi:secreted trypsin-like serine protease